jgi:hypothetical protein
MGKYLTGDYDLANSSIRRAEPGKKQSQKTESNYI